MRSKITSSLLNFDRECLKGSSCLLGVDEAGRGACAGPVVAAAVWVNPNFYQDAICCQAASTVNDSKQLKPEQREEQWALFETWQADNRVSFAWAEGTVAEVEKYNVLGATRLAMARALAQLALRQGLVLPLWESAMPLFFQAVNGVAQLPRVLVDGLPLKGFPYHHDGIVRGDAKSFVIAMASIVAKVTRDRLMVDFDKQYPQYGFKRHKGYGTQAHYQALYDYGLVDLHRPSFLKKMLRSSNRNL